MIKALIIAGAALLFFAALFVFVMFYTTKKTIDDLRDDGFYD